MEEQKPRKNDLYILHFKSRYWSNARHYVGYTSLGVDERIKTHRAGRGSLLVKYALDKGVDFKVGLVEHFDTKEQARYREIRLKREGHLSRHCKICEELRQNAKI
jgi:predicted GIY-YIG superfamily endonuclease